MTPDPQPHALRGPMEGVLVERIGVGIRDLSIGPEMIVAALFEKEGGSR